MSSPDETELDAKLREVDRSIAELQGLRRELLKSKNALHSKADAHPSEAPKSGTGDRAIERALNMLEWRSFKKREGEWTFMRDMKGNLVEDLKDVTGFVDELRRGKQVVVGKYRYSASEDKFLNRYPA
ncbi:MAG: hypothetical protein JRN09_02505 [Nitrososphaerota archaeon]|nr:hypothetical protein [Nitrososphaerota archaeon]